MSFRIQVLLLVVACIFFVASDAKSGKEKIEEKCAKEYKLDKAAIEKFNKTRPLETKDKNIKCYLKCLLVETKLMNAKGEITIPKIENKEVAEAAKSCKSVTSKDACEKAFKFHKCLVEKEEAKHKGHKKPAEHAKKH